jgi:hypothetical protein
MSKQDKTTLTMAIGLQINGTVFNHATVDGNLLPAKNRKAWKPSADSCNFLEIKRRRIAIGMDMAKYSDRQLTIPMKYIWLVENPIQDANNDV